MRQHCTDIRSRSSRQRTAFDCGYNFLPQQTTSRLTNCCTGESKSLNFSFQKDNLPNKTFNKWIIIARGFDYSQENCSIMQPGLNYIVHLSHCTAARQQNPLKAAFKTLVEHLHQTYVQTQLTFPPWHFYYHRTSARFFLPYAHPCRLLLHRPITDTWAERKWHGKETCFVGTHGEKKEKENFTDKMKFSCLNNSFTGPTGTAMCFGR